MNTISTNMWGGQIIYDESFYFQMKIFQVVYNICIFIYTHVYTGVCVYLCPYVCLYI